MHHLPAVPKHHLHIRGIPGESRATGGRGRPGAADVSGSPRPGGGGGGRKGGGGGADASRYSSRGERVLPGHQRRVAPAVLEKSLEEDKRGERKYVREFHGLASLFRIYLKSLFLNQGKYTVHPLILIILRSEDLILIKLNVVQLFRHN